MTEDPFESPSASLAAEAEPEARPGIPWENEQSFPALAETFKAIAREPTRLFQSAGQDLPIGPALTYGLAIGIIGGFGAALWGTAMTALLSLGGDSMQWLTTVAGSGLSSLVSVPIGVITGIFVGAGLVHLMLLITGGPHRSFDTTVRAVAFASGTAAILQVVPVVGAFIGYVVSVVLEIHAIREMHGTTTSTAALAVLMPTLLCVGVVGGLGAMAYLFFQRA